MSQHDAQVRELAEDIAAHLKANPHAADTLEGVCSWWLDRSRRSASREGVRRALERLIALGIVKRESLAGGETVYSACGDADR